MINSYSATMAGPYHVAHNIPCQDSLAVFHGRGFAVAAVADGVGSASRSDAGSRLACDTAVRVCSYGIYADMPTQDIAGIFEDAFTAAYGAVCLRAQADGAVVTDYDTTLCLAFWDGHRLAYGQSGDSGIVAALSDGRYVMVTEQQRDGEGRVFPLRFGPRFWRFESVSEPVASVLLATDGVLEELCHPLLRFRDEPINTALARLFLHRTEEAPEERNEFERDAYEFLRTYPENALDDDKTVVILADPSRPPALLGEAYYAPPAWEALRAKAKEGFYPGLAKDDEKSGGCVDAGRCAQPGVRYSVQAGAGRSMQAGARIRRPAKQGGRKHGGGSNAHAALRGRRKSASRTCKKPTKRKPGNKRRRVH